MRPLLALLLCACGSPASVEDASEAVEADIAQAIDAAILDRAQVRDEFAPADMDSPDLAVLASDMVVGADLAIGADMAPEADLDPGPHAQAATAFTLDADGWIPVQIIAPAPRHSAGVPLVARWSPSGGDGDDGCIYTDAVGAEVYWQAPQRFLGNRSAVYGGSLTFSLKSPILPCFDQDVILVGGGLVAVRQLHKVMIKAWQSYNVPLYAGAWHKDTDYGDLLTEQEFRSVLGNLTMLRIHAGAIGVGFNQAAWLDNVAIYRQ